MKKLLPLLAILLSMGACINDQENIEIIHDRDLKAIEAFLRDTEIKSVRTEQDGETGIVIIWVEENHEGIPSRLGDSLWVDYTGQFLDGRVFDTSKETVAKDNGIFNQGRDYEPMGIVFGMEPTRMIFGFEFALYNMKEGDKAVVLIPSSLAYGRTGSRDGSIPPNTPLRFDIDLIKVAEEEPSEI